MWLPIYRFDVGVNPERGKNRITVLVRQLHKVVVRSDLQRTTASYYILEPLEVATKDFGDYILRLH